MMAGMYKVTAVEGFLLVATNCSVESPYVWSYRAAQGEAGVRVGSVLWLIEDVPTRGLLENEEGRKHL